MDGIQRNRPKREVAGGESEPVLGLQWTKTKNFSFVSPVAMAEPRKMGAGNMLQQRGLVRVCSHGGVGFECGFGAGRWRQESRLAGRVKGGRRDHAGLPLTHKS